MWKSIRNLFYSIFKNKAKNLKYIHLRAFFKNATKPLEMFFFFFQKNILPLTKHDLVVERLHNFRKKKKGLRSKENIFRLTIASRTNGALTSMEISSALHQSPCDLKLRDLSPCLLFQGRMIFSPLLCLQYLNSSLNIVWLLMNIYDRYSFHHGTLPLVFF